MRLPNNILQRCLIIIIVLQVILIFLVSQKRFFNFDEFQVLYASASLIKGKALYHNEIGGHFPLVNIFFALMLKVVGFKTSSLLVARLVVFCFIVLTLVITYKIAEVIKDKETGLLAVVLTISSITFVTKGIEIRHDVFNMFFNIAGVYWAIKYLITNRKLYVILSGVCLGLALASTQKAFIWHLGIIYGVSIFLLREYGFKRLVKILGIYSITIFFSLFMVLMVLFIVYNENFYSLFKITILDTYHYLIPNSLLKAQPSTPFLYSKIEIFRHLLLDNGLFYIISLIGIISELVRGYKRPQIMYAVVFWALTGCLFYMYMKRPFYQSFLPTIPALGIVASMLLMGIKNRISTISVAKRNYLYTLTIILLLGHPSYLLVKMTFAEDQWMKLQMRNVSFCLDNLKPNDKVLCFTQQQIYFDPIFSAVGKNECGHSISTIEKTCFEKKMIENKCKIVIYDHRTRLLNREIQDKIKRQYIYTGVGDILIPGFSLQPDKEVQKKIWTPGFYYSPTSQLMVNGKKINDNTLKLEQNIYTFKNLTDAPIFLLYVFDSKRVKSKNKL